MVIDNSSSALREEFIDALAARGVDQAQAATIVNKLVAYLQDTRAGTTLYIPRPGRTYPVDAIRAAFADGASGRAICRRYRIDRRTLYALLDAGCDA